jgi:hypothetical protein
MTDFTNARTVKCHVCGQPYCDQEGRLCDCAQCEICEEWFADDVKDGFCSECDDLARESSHELYWALKDTSEQLKLYLIAVEDGKDDDAESAYQHGLAIIAKLERR